MRSLPDKSGEGIIHPGASARVTPLAWIPVALLLVVVVYLYGIPERLLTGGVLLIPVLDLSFTTVISFLIASLLAGSYLSGGHAESLLLGAGVLGFGTANLLSSIQLPYGQLDSAVVVYNTGMCLSALFTLTAAVWRVPPMRRRFGGSGWAALAGCYGGVLLGFGLILWVDSAGIFPPFYLLSGGPTRLGKSMLGVAAAAVGVSATLLYTTGVRDRSPFLQWFAMGAALVAVGLLGFVDAESTRSMIAWAGRAAKYLGSVYLVIAVTVNVKSSSSWMVYLEKMREYQKQYASLVESSLNAILVHSRDQVLSANRAAARLFGEQDMDAVVGRSIMELVHPASRQEFTGNLDRVLLLDRASPLLDIRFNGPDGSVVETETIMVRTEFEGLPAVQLMIHDVTDRRRAEEQLRVNERRYRSLFNSLQEGFGLAEIMLDDQGRPCDYRLLEVNDAYCRLTGIPRENVLGRTARELFDNFGQEYIRTFGRVALAGEPEHFELHSQQFGKTFELFVFSPEQGVFGHLFFDITDRKRAEKDLRELNENLEQQVRERTALAEERSRQLQIMAVKLIEAEEQERRRIADILHDDLQQVLASAKMHCHTLREEVGPEENLQRIEELLADSIRKSRHLSHELNPAALLHADLSDSMEWLAKQMQANHGLQVELAGWEDWNVVRDSEAKPIKLLLIRSVQELLFNTAKYAGTDISRVELAGADSSLTITVSDQGKGFDPSALESPSERISGFGLLSIRERMSSIGGSFTFESAPGEGTRATLVVPRSLLKARSTSNRKKKAAARSQPLQRSIAGLGGYRVMFVDDHKVMRQGLIALTSGQPNVQVVGEASNGRAAVDMARELRPDVILMDVSMPEMDGIEATRIIKSEMPGVGVIGLTMYNDEHIFKAMRDAGADLVLSKTDSSASILQAIYQAADHA